MKSPWEEIRKAEGIAFERIASVDSPFRELVTWSYLQVAGRPGLPDRDLDEWAEGIDEARDTP